MPRLEPVFGSRRPERENLLWETHSRGFTTEALTDALPLDHHNLSPGLPPSFRMR